MFFDEDEKDNGLPDKETVRSVFFKLVYHMAEERDAHGIATAKERYAWDLGAVWMLRFLTGHYPDVEFFRSKLKSPPSVYPDQIKDISDVLDESYHETILSEVLRPADHDDALQAEICKNCIYASKIRPDGGPMHLNYVYCKKQKIEIEYHCKCKVGRWGYFV